MFMTTDGTAPNRFFVQQHCASGARANLSSACFSCPNFMRRSELLDVCFECGGHTTAGGLPSTTSCQSPCPNGMHRPLGQDTCEICPAGCVCFLQSSQLTCTSHILT